MPDSSDTTAGVRKIVRELREWSFELSDLALHHTGEESPPQEHLVHRAADALENLYIQVNSGEWARDAETYLTGEVRRLSQAVMGGNATFADDDLGFMAALAKWALDHGADREVDPGVRANLLSLREVTARAEKAEAERDEAMEGLRMCQPITDWLITQSFTCMDVDGAELQDVLVKHSAIQEVAYDPAVHGEIEEAEPGDPTYTRSPQARRARSILDKIKGGEKDG